MFVSSFPPGAQTVLRALQFARYLPEFGWTPVVLTARQNAGSSPSASSAPEGVAVFRTGRLPTPSMLARRWRARGPVTPATEGPRPPATPSEGFIARAARQWLLWFDTPDAFVGWLPPSLWRGLRLARSLRPAAVLATGPPFSVVLAGAIVARATGLPFVADFRDAWTLDPADPIGTMGGEFVTRRSRLRTRVLRALERWCLSSADVVLLTSTATGTLYREAYPEHAERMHVIYNGAAPEDFAGDVSPFATPTIAYVGTLHDFQGPQVVCFLQAFAAACGSGRLPPATRSVFVGPVSASLLPRIQRSVDELGLTGSVEFRGAVPHAEAIDWMRRSQLLLLFAGENPYVRLSKLSEYVAAGAPLLAFASADSETGRETLRYAGRVVDTRVDQATQVLAELMQGDGARRRHDFFSEPHPLSRRTEAGDLARLLDDVRKGAP
jgi:glycosyltransferase involved in cell wall biosynthesis